MASKVGVVLVVCLVLATVVQVARAQTLLDQYKDCFKQCHDGCQTDGNGNSFCEMKCDGVCMAKETAARLEKGRQDMAAERQNVQNSDQPAQAPPPDA